MSIWWAKFKNVNCRIEMSVTNRRLFYIVCISSILYEKNYPTSNNTPYKGLIRNFSVKIVGIFILGSWIKMKACITTVFANLSDINGFKLHFRFSCCLMVFGERDDLSDSKSPRLRFEFGNHHVFPFADCHTFFFSGTSCLIQIFFFPNQHILCGIKRKRKPAFFYSKLICQLGFESLVGSMSNSPRVCASHSDTTVAFALAAGYQPNTAPTHQLSQRTKSGGFQISATLGIFPATVTSHGCV